MRVEGLRYYAGSMTAAVILMILLSMGMDLLETFVVFFCFAFVPSFLIPFLIYPEEDIDDDDTE